jgi:SAM-dependent methyltransferase
MAQTIRKIWERVSGREPRRLWSQLSITQNELSITQNELSITQNELSITQNRIQKIVGEVIEVFDSNFLKSKKESVEVGVVVTTKNRPRLLLRALTSINFQSRKPQEIVIVNNGDKFSDLEEKEIRNACDLISNVKIIDGQHLFDVSECRATGLSASTQKYIAYLDDDNIMWPLWLEKAYEYISENELGFIYGSELREDDEFYYFYQEFSEIKIRENNFIDTNSIMHLRTTGRWTPGVSRLSDWCFVLNHLFDYPQEKIMALESISAIYKIDAPNRITNSLSSPYQVLIGLLHGLIPNSKAILKNETKYCVICNSSNRFSNGPNGRENATCETCGSLERHRALKIINEVISDFLIKNQVLGKIIEVAPSNVSRKIFSSYGSNYESFDLNPSVDGRDCDFVADVCDMPLANDSVSQFVALHVLEHVPNDQLAMKEISRVLAPHGICILQVPLAQLPVTTKEEFILDDYIRIREYGQIDHVRLYGEDILERIKNNGMVGNFLSIEEVLPKYLVNFLGLGDGMKFIISVSNNNSSSIVYLNKLLQALKMDLARLQIFCGVFDKSD